MNTLVLGVDIGGVLIDKYNDKYDTSFFSASYLSSSATLGAFEALRSLVEGKFGREVYLVSKSGPDTERKTLEWLEHHRFYERTGIPEGRAYFCRKRHEKAGICEKLGVTHFIDDRLEVLSYLTTVGQRYLFQPEEREIARFVKFLPQVTRAESWQEILAKEFPQK